MENINLSQLEQAILDNGNLDKQSIQFVATRTSSPEILRILDETYVGNSVFNWVYISAKKLYIANAIAGNQYTPLDILKRYIKWSLLGHSLGHSFGKVAYQNKKSRTK